MFAALQANMPKFETKKAMIITNMQNDTFERRGGVAVCEPQDFRDTIQKVVPCFRRMGDIIWVRTEFGGSDTETKSQSAPPEVESEEVNEDRTARLTIDDLTEAEFRSRQIDGGTIVGYFPSSRLKAQMRKASEKARADFREEEAEGFKSDEEGDAYLDKPRKGTSAIVYVPGTRGAEFTPDTLANIDESNDIILVKNHYSAFDATPLLVSLRMKLVTHIYLAGSLSNISIYATAADAVRHGFEVTVVEDCIGYRSEARHYDAMQKMADLLGVSGIDSEEIIEESGGRIPPDADPNLFSGPGLEGIRSRADLADPVSRTIREHLRKTTLGSSEAVKAKTQLKMQAQTLPEPGRRISPEGSASPTEMDGIEKRTPSSTLGPGQRIGEGDSQIIHNALSKTLAENAFKLVKDEVDWQIMRHRNGEVPRRVAVQGEYGTQGAVPLYRHPADETPRFQDFTSTVRKICDEIQILLKQPFNHCLLQLYRNGQDNISEHADKTLDIVRGSSIVNLSLGAQRNMTLRTKKVLHPAQANTGSSTPRNSQKVPMPHNSVFVLGSRTNSKWLHGVRADRRPQTEKSDEERAYGGQRISLTFRNIGTFTNRPRTRIWGQGAKSKFQATAGAISTANNAEMEAMITAFGKENHQVDFDWDAEYGAGFDVINLVVTKAPSSAILFLCGDELSNLRVKVAVFERGIPCRMTRTKAKDIAGKRSPVLRRTIFSLSGDENPLFRDNDANRSESVGDLAILFYINRFYPAEPEPGTVSAREMHRVASNVFARITQANELLFLWQELRGTPFNASTRATHQVRRLSVEPAAAAMAAAAAAANTNTNYMSATSNPATANTTTASSPASSTATLPSSSLSAAAATVNAQTAHAYSHAPHPSQGHPARMYSLAEGIRPAEAFEGEMEVWEEYAEEAEYIGGEVFTIVDCGFWPVLNEVVRRWEGWSERRYPNLANYWRKVGAMEAVRRAVMERGDEGEV